MIIGKPRSFEELLIDRFLKYQEWSAKELYSSNDPNISCHVRTFREDLAKSYTIDAKLVEFITNVSETMALDIDDATFRKIIGTFYTDMVREVMNNADSVRERKDS